MTRKEQSMPFHGPMDELHMTQVIVKKLPFYIAQKLERDSLYVQDLNVIIDEIADEMAYKIIALTGKFALEPLGNYKGRKTYEVPRSWFQMLKRDYFPSWFVRRFPVLNESHKLEIEVDVSAVYPKLHHAFNDQVAYFNYVEQG